MNKWQIICPLAAMALFLVLCIPPTCRRMNMERHDNQAFRASIIGRSLTKTTNSSDLLSIDPPLKQALAQFLTTPTAYTERVIHGDESPPLGDGTATLRLSLENEKGERLVLRLKKHTKPDKFQVLGFWQTNSVP